MQPSFAYVFRKVPNLATREMHAQRAFKARRPPPLRRIADSVHLGNSHPYTTVEISRFLQTIVQWLISQDKLGAYNVHCPSGVVPTGRRCRVHIVSLRRNDIRDSAGFSHSAPHTDPQILPDFQPFVSGISTREGHSLGNCARCRS